MLIRYHADPRRETHKCMGVPIHVKYGFLGVVDFIA